MSLGVPLLMFALALGVWGWAEVQDARRRTRAPKTPSNGLDPPVADINERIHHG